MPVAPDLTVLPRELAQGSRFLTIADLLHGDPSAWLFRNPTATRIGDPDHVVTDVLGELAEHVHQGRRVVLLGGPDIGKTTTAYAMMQYLNQTSGGPAAKRRAVVVDLAHYLNDYRRWPDYFGTTLWLRSAGPHARGAVRTRERPLMILDGLDALLRGAASRNEPDAVLRRSLFTDAVAVTCSEAVFRQSGARDLLGEVEVYRLEGLSMRERMRFGRRAVTVLAHRFGLGAERAERLCAEIDRAVRRDGNNAQTFREPLYLLLQVEAIVDGGSSNPRLDYYVASGLEQETSSGARTLPTADMIEVLSDIAWLLQPHQVDTTRPHRTRGEPAATSSDRVRIQPLGSSALDSFVKATAERLRLSADALRAELTQCKFLDWSAEGVTITGTSPTVVGGRATPGLGVYQDYLVARGITRRLLVPEEGLAERFATLLPGGVVVLLVEELMRISRSQELRRRVLSRLRVELLDAAEKMACADVRGGADELERLRNRTVCEQLSYYLAVTAGGGPEGDAVLRLVDTRAVLREDLWIRRGVTVGLGFGGRDGVIHHYVVELLDEQARHDALCPGECSVGENRRVNVEFNLVLFGDAAPLHGVPDRCAYPDECSQTLGGMLDLLEVDLLEQPGGSELSELVLFLIADLHDYHWDRDPTRTLAEPWRLFFQESAADVSTQPEDASAEPWTPRRRLEEAMKRLSSNDGARPMIDRIWQLLPGSRPSG